MHKKPKYILAKEMLIQRFQAERFEDHQQIPTENQLIEELGFSRNTIRQAITELVQDGLLKKEQGRGTFFVKEKPRENRTRLIGVINYYSTFNIYPQIIQGIEDVAHENQYSLIISNSNNSLSREIEALERMVSQGIEGLIYEPHNNTNMSVFTEENIYQRIMQLGIPIVSTHCSLPLKRTCSVNIDDLKAGKDAGEFLYNKGHRNVGVIYKESVQAGVQRKEGLIDFFRQKGIKISPEKIRGFTGEIPEERPGYFITKEFMEKEPPSAIFYFNDETAVQGYQYLTEEGFKIPDDVSILGFDNLHTGSLVFPPITTFDHPKADLGRWACRLLINLIDHPYENYPEIVFHPKIQDFGSVKDLNNLKK